MPTKPITQPEPWATAGTYPASNYPATYPWDTASNPAPHPQAGNPTPWSTQPRTNAVGLVGFAATGNVPLAAQSGDLWNEEYQRVVALSRWTFLGTTAPDEDAHVVETDATGQITAAVGVFGGNASLTTGLTVNTTPGASSAQINGTDNGGLAVGVVDSTAFAAINNSNDPTISTLNSGFGPDIQTIGSVVVGGILTPQSGINLAGQTVGGTAGSLVDVETVRPGTVEWVDQGSSIPGVDRSQRFNDTTSLMRGADGVVRSISIPDRGSIASLSTNATIQNTGCSAQRRVTSTEPVWIRATFSYRSTAAAATGLLNTRIAVTGSVSGGPIDLFFRNFHLDSSLDWLPWTLAVPWTVATDFPLAGVENWLVELRAGSNLGANLELEDLSIELVSNVRV